MRRSLRLSFIALVVSTGLALAACGSSSGSTGLSSTAPRTSTTGPAADSAAGAPGAAVTDALPAGAPAGPVKVAPPPTALVSEDIPPGTGAAAPDTSAV